MLEMSFDQDKLVEIEKYGVELLEVFCILNVREIIECH